MKHSKKKKRSRPPNQVGTKGAGREEESEERRVLKSLMEAFTSVSLEEAASAYREANGDPSKAAEILGGLAESADYQATSCSGSSGSATLSSGSGPSSEEVFMESSCGGNGVHGRGFRGTEQKKVITSIETVSTILGKEYVRSSPRKDSSKPSMAVVREVQRQCRYDVEKLAMRAASPAAAAPSAQVVANAFVEQYYHILQQSPKLVYQFYQDSSILSRPDSNGVMTSVTTMQAINDKILSLDYGNYEAEIKTADAQESYNGGVIVLVTGCLTGKDNVRKKFTQTFFLAPQQRGYFVLNDVFRYVEESESLEVNSMTVNGINNNAPMSPLPSDPRCEPIRGPDHPALEPLATSETEDLNNGSEVLTGSKVHSPTSPRSSELELPQMVLESLFNMPKSSEHEPNVMNWRDVVKKMESVRQRFDCDPADATQPEHIHAKGDAYQAFRKSAMQHWDSMKSYNQKAATAFSNEEWEYAALLSEQARSYKKLALKEEEKASQKIFKYWNKSRENVITIDLHGQQVKQAIKLLKVHLVFGAYVPSVQIFRVITGRGSHSVGKPKLKQSVINLVKKEGIEWSEESPGTILIRLDGQREFSFVESENDSD